MMQTLMDKIEMERRIPSIHKNIHYKIVERECKLLKEIPIDETRFPRELICKMLDKHSIAKNIQNEFLNEMESYGLIKIINRQSIEIIKKN